MTRANALRRSPRPPTRAGAGGACVALLASLALVTLMVGLPRSASGAPVLVAATPTCKEWQTVTPVPGPGARSGPAQGTHSPSTTPTVPTRLVCRNAPPTPFPHPGWALDTVVGGARLAETGVVVDVPAGGTQPPVVPDVSYVVADMETGEILAAKSPHDWLRPASTLKTLTALTLLPRINPNYPVVASPENVAANGTRVGMIAGNTYAAHHLFDAMLMLSANDAVYGLTDAVGGYDRAVALMNGEAHRIGAFDTVAVDPSGLDEPGQHSSAYDLALIGRAAMELPAFREYVTKRDAVFPGGTDTAGRFHKPFHIPNINDLLSAYPGAIGIKPGRTNRAQHTFIGAATRQGRTLIVSQMGSTTGDWRDTAALLDWGFANAAKVHPVGHLVEPGDAAPPSPEPSATASETTGAQPAAVPSAAGGPPMAAAESPSKGYLDDQTASTLMTAGVAVGGGVIVVVAAVVLIRRRRLNSSSP